MPIETKDLVIYKPERLTDNEDGGGKYSGQIIEDGLSNNLFDDISELNRTTGDVSMRKIFPAVTTADTDKLMGATVFISELPKDPNVSALLFSTKSWTDERKAAQNRVENYLAKGGQSAGTPLDTHYQGMKILQVAMFPQETESAVGDSIVLVSNEGKALQHEQYVRITKVETRTAIIVMDGKNFEYKIATYTLSDALDQDFVGLSAKQWYNGEKSTTIIPLDSDVIGLSATRLPLDGRVPIFRVGGVGIVSASKSFELPDHVPGKTYDLPDQRIAWCELEDASGIKVPFDMYTVDYDYGRFTLNGDFALNTLVPPLKAKYRFQDMGLIRDVQINGQLTFTKPLTHNYEAKNTVVGSALIIDEMQARYTRKFVQQTWNSMWADEASGGAISANYNDSLYPFAVSNKGAIQERWAIVFTDTTTFKCVGEYTGELALRGTINVDYGPINPVTNAPYFTIKKEGWGSGWANGNVLRFNTIAANYPVWVIRTVKQSEPSQISDQFQIMLRGDIDRVV